MSRKLDREKRKRKAISNLNFQQTMEVERAIRELEPILKEEIQENERRFALISMIFVIVNVMSGEGYWEKTYKKRIPKLFEDIASLLTAQADNTVTWEEIENLAKDGLGGFDIDKNLIEKMMQRK